VANAPLLLSYKPAAAAIRMHLAVTPLSTSSLGSSTETAAIPLPDRVLRPGLKLPLELAQPKIPTAAQRHGTLFGSRQLVLTKNPRIWAAQPSQSPDCISCIAVAAVLLYY
jgi:hypothetical protein